MIIVIILNFAGCETELAASNSQVLLGFRVAWSGQVWRQKSKLRMNRQGMGNGIPVPVRQGIEAGSNCQDFSRLVAAVSTPGRAHFRDIFVAARRQILSSCADVSADRGSKNVCVATRYPAFRRASHAITPDVLPRSTYAATPRDCARKPRFLKVADFSENWCL